MLVESMNIGRYTKALNGAGNAASLSEDYRKLYDILEINGMLHFGIRGQRQEWRDLEMLKKYEI